MPPPANGAAAAAAVSGPGKYSQRTDGGPAQELQAATRSKQPIAALPNAKYGENKAFQGLQQGAPLAQTNQPPTQDQGFAPNPAAANVVPFSAPTQRPNEPVTAGAALGAGPGPEVLSSAPANVDQQDVTKASDVMAVFEALANFPDALPGARYLVNSTKAMQP